MAILIVDDSNDSRLLLQLILRKSGYHELLTAASARDAFAQLGMGDSANTDMEVDLVLMDIMMPEVDGIEACQCIRAVERFRDLPIIMVTAKAEANYLEAAFKAGAVDYITKPSIKTEVAARVRSALALKQETDSRKRAHAELEETNQILIKETLAKSQILSTVTHELKTPLTSIVGYADRLLFHQADVGQLNERQQRYIKTISESSHHLEALVNDLLDISIIEAGKLEINPIDLEVENPRRHSRRGLMQSGTPRKPNLDRLLMRSI